jgi:hypothetical protein
MGRSISSWLTYLFCTYHIAMWSSLLPPSPCNTHATVVVTTIPSHQSIAMPMASHDQPSKNKSGTYCTLTPSSPAPSSSAPTWGHYMFFVPMVPPYRYQLIWTLFMLQMHWTQDTKHHIPTVKKTVDCYLLCCLFVQLVLLSLWANLYTP